MVWRGIAVINDTMGVNSGGMVRNWFVFVDQISPDRVAQYDGNPGISLATLPVGVRMLLLIADTCLSGAG